LRARRNQAGCGGFHASFPGRIRPCCPCGLASGATAYDGALDKVWLAPTAISRDDAGLARYGPL